MELTEKNTLDVSKGFNSTEEKISEFGDIEIDAVIPGMVTRSYNNSYSGSLRLGGSQVEASPAKS
jgi:hypothetical protein